MHYTERLKLEQRQLSEQERSESERVVALCEQKLQESPAPQTIIGRLVDYFSEAKQLREIHNTQLVFHNRILAAEQVETLRCMPREVVQISPFEDEGHHYIFDIGEGRLFFFGGQNYPPSRKFPNTEFELVRLPGGSVFQMNKTGEKLPPSKKISGKAAADLRVPSGTCFTFSGSLQAFEESFAEHVSTLDAEGDCWTV